MLGGIADDLLYHGDLEAALRRLLQEGFSTADGRRIQGLQELLSRLRRRRQELAAHDLGGLTEGLVRNLDEILSLERSALDEALRRDPTDPAAERAANAHNELDLLPEGLAERLGALSRYEFASAEAGERFNELVERLRHDLAQLFLDRAAAAAAKAGPAEREHLRAGLAALNEMLAQRARGEELDPSFQAFMDEFGDLFPGASSLDELLRQLATRMAGASALLASMDPDQRAQLEQLSQELLSDLDLAWQIDQLAEGLRGALPGLGWDQAIPGGRGSPPLGLGEAGDLFEELTELGHLERLLGSTTEPGALLEVDPEAAAHLLGPDAADSLEALAKLTRRLEEAGLVDRREGRLTLTPRGLRRLGTRALDEVFGRLGRSRLGDHPVPQPGTGHERSGKTKPYEHGDPFHLDIQETIRNAVLRNAAGAPGGRPVVPVGLAPEDFAIEQTEQASAASTVLAVDLSLSMPMRDNFLAAKKVAIALQALIASQYPRDYLGLVGFSATAREIKPSELPEVSWDFAYGTNLQHALALSRRLLANRPGARQIVLITDGEPTAHALEDGEVYFHYPPAPETIKATLLEVGRCTRERITINTFVLDATGSLRAFVEQMTRRNKGRAFFTTPDRLGDYVLLDFVEHRRASRQRRLRPGA